jgi:hypothetical protein
MTFERGYAVGDLNGPDLFLDGAGFEDAVQEAKSAFPRSRILFDGDIDQVLENEPNLAVPNFRRGVAPRQALKQSGLHRLDPNVVMSYSPYDANCTIQPFFRYLDGCAMGSYGAAHQTKVAMFGTNYKLAKGLVAKHLPRGAKKGMGRGLSLLPHTRAQEFSDYDLPMSGKGLCIGSSPECRRLCLLYTGQNPVGDANGPGKLRKTEALLLRPEAFMRMVVEGARWHEEYCRSRKYVPYLRLNMLSDIPWELVLPELFDELCPNVRWYDYTKVPDRPMQDNYHLTFSFNGHNWSQCKREIARGRSAAVVFWLPKTINVTEVVFRGMPVTIDGDLHDFRPLDPSGSLVGMTYKVPVVKGQRLTKRPAWANKFVAPAFRDRESGLVLVPQTAASTQGNETFKHADPKLLV